MNDRLAWHEIAIVIGFAAMLAALVAVAWFAVWMAYA